MFVLAGDIAVRMLKNVAQQCVCHKMMQHAAASDIAMFKGAIAVRMLQSRTAMFVSHNEKTDS